MMPLRKFTIHQPKTIAEASQMLAEFGETEIATQGPAGAHADIGDVGFHRR